MQVDRVQKSAKIEIMNITGSRWVTCARALSLCARAPGSVSTEDDIATLSVVTMLTFYALIFK